MSGPDFRTKLQEQLGYIERSAEAFDQGHREEAIRIAVALRVLLHDTSSSSTSLLTHLGARESVELLSTCPVRESSPPGFGQVKLTMFVSGLTRTRVSANKGAELYAPLGDALDRQLVSVKAWWDEVVWIAGGVKLRRRNIILDAANKDGGAHVDATLTSKYMLIRKPGAAGFANRVEGGVKLQLPVDPSASMAGEPLSDAHLVALRQMGYEILNSPEMTELTR